jgi:mannose-6-phosphate isomerase
MQPLTNQIQPYAWGSHTALAQLLGRAPSATPEAELWLGAHPQAPSRLDDGRTLADFIAHAPMPALGARVVERFGERLPFLLKVLAAEAPLSLQAHPTLEQARTGFAREEAQGVPRTAPSRNYKDANHKPELICALTPFDALCGFRAVARTVELFRALAVPGLPLQTLSERGLQAFFAEVMTLEAHARTALARATVEACRARPAPGFTAECAWGVKLGQAYPGDVGVVGALLLNLVTLAPGQALALGAGNLHAYLQGTGVELMASSDNVLRGGLTPKHVDVPELLQVLDFSAGPAKVLTAQGAPEAVYETGVEDFRLSRFEVTGPTTFDRLGPDILLVTFGRVSVTTRETRTFAQGQSVFLAADEGPVRLEGAGTVYRATVNP